MCRAVRLNGPRDCLGTREQLSEEDELQPNGKVFKKVCFGTKSNKIHSAGEWAVNIVPVKQVIC